MALVNHDTGEVVFKIVYCGTPLGGKTTNLTYIHHRIGKQHRGDLISLATSSDRTLFFDFLPVHAAVINGYKTRFQLYTVPGQVYYNATRQLVLRGVDGLVFVADSLPNRLEQNVESFRTMLQNLGQSRADPARLPLVLQYNKRDLPGVASVTELDRALNNGAIGRRLSTFEAVAPQGHNVLATLNAVSQEILRRFHSLAQSTAKGPASAATAPAHPSPAPGREPASGTPAPMPVPSQAVNPPAVAT